MVEGKRKLWIQSVENVPFISRKKRKLDPILHLEQKEYLEHFDELDTTSEELEDLNELNESEELELEDSGDSEDSEDLNELDEFNEIIDIYKVSIHNMAPKEKEFIDKKEKEFNDENLIKENLNPIKENLNANANHNNLKQNIITTNKPKKFQMIINDEDIDFVKIITKNELNSHQLHQQQLIHNEKSENNFSKRGNNINLIDTYKNDKTIQNNNKNNNISIKVSAINKLEIMSSNSDSIEDIQDIQDNEEIIYEESSSKDRNSEDSSMIEDSSIEYNEKFEKIKEIDDNTMFRLKVANVSESNLFVPNFLVTNCYKNSIKSWFRNIPFQSNFITSNQFENWNNATHILIGSKFKSEFKSTISSKLLYGLSRSLPIISKKLLGNMMKSEQKIHLNNLPLRSNQLYNPIKRNNFFKGFTFSCDKILLNEFKINLNLWELILRNMGGSWTNNKILATFIIKPNSYENLNQNNYISESFLSELIIHLNWDRIISKSNWSSNLLNQIKSSQNSNNWVIHNSIENHSSIINDTINSNNNEIVSMNQLVINNNINNINEESDQEIKDRSINDDSSSESSEQNIKSNKDQLYSNHEEMYISIKNENSFDVNQYNQYNLENNNFESSQTIEEIFQSLEMSQQTQDNNYSSMEEFQNTIHQIQIQNEEVHSEDFSLEDIKEPKKLNKISIKNEVCNSPTEESSFSSIDTNLFKSPAKKIISRNNKTPIRTIYLKKLEFLTSNYVNIECIIHREYGKDLNSYQIRMSKIFDSLQNDLKFKTEVTNCNSIDKLEKLILPPERFNLKLNFSHRSKGILPTMKEAI